MLDSSGWAYILKCEWLHLVLIFVFFVMQLRGESSQVVVASGTVGPNLIHDSTTRVGTDVKGTGL